MTDKNIKPDPSTYLAAERTLLAWVRTGLALMGFGFVVARFGMFLRELQAAHAVPETHAPDASLWFGTALIFLGIVVCVLSVVHHVRFMGKLADKDASFGRPSGFAIAVALVLAAIGVGLALYLFLVGHK